MVAALAGTTADDVRIRHLYQLHGQPLYRFLLRFTLGERHAAEDLLQETLLRAWRNLDALTPDMTALRPWLFTVARRIAIDAGRMRQARPAEAAADPSALAATEDPIERFLTAHHLRTALGALAPDQRRVLLELFYRERSPAEAAIELGIPEGTVKSRAHAAIGILRRRLWRCG